MRFLADFGDADDARFGATRMIEKHVVAFLHFANEVACGVIAHTAPRFGFARGEIVDGELVRLGFHQPVIHGDSFCAVQSISSRSVAMKSIGTSHALGDIVATSWKW